MTNQCRWLRPRRDCRGRFPLGYISFDRLIVEIGSSFSAASADVGRSLILLRGEGVEPRGCVARPPSRYGIISIGETACDCSRNEASFGSQVLLRSVSAKHREPPGTTSVR
jgi:hypothetical protein